MKGGRTIRRIEQVKCYCLSCWARLVFSIEWHDLEGKTMKDIEKMCNDKHAKVCTKANVRLGNATKTR